MTERLTHDEIDTALAALQGWRREDDCLTKDIPVTPDSYGWLSEAVHNEAAGLGRAPEIQRTDDGLRLRLSTREAGGVTAQDVELAARIDQVLSGAARDRG